MNLHYPKRSRVLTPALVRAVVDEFVLPTLGEHGPAHWFRVRANGLCIARENGADAEIVELFALFHDSGRRGEVDDPDHGRRGALLASRLRGSLFELNDERFAHLQRACRCHSDCNHLDIGDVTVRTCLDADRLDLGRVDITPDPERLFTAAARSPELLTWAYRRSRLGG